MLVLRIYTTRRDAARALIYVKYQAIVVSSNVELSELQQERLYKAAAEEASGPSDDVFEDLWMEASIEQADQAAPEYTSEQSAPDWYIRLIANDWYEALSERDKSDLFEDYSLSEEIESIITETNSRTNPEHMHEGILLSFIRRIINGLGLQAKSILDPICGYGDILYLASTATNADKVHGITAYPDSFNVATKLHLKQGNTIVRARYTDAVGYLLDKYDIIIADALPSSQKLDYCGNELSHAKLYVSLVEFAGNRLENEGVFILIVESAFFAHHNKQEIICGITGVGLQISSIIYLGSGETIGTGQEGYLLLLQKGSQSKVVVGCMKEDPNHQRALINNIKKRSFKGDASLGRWRNLDDFTSFERVSTQESLQRIARDKGWSGHLGINIFIDHELIGPYRHEQRLQPSLYSFYLNLTGKLRAERSIDSLDVKYNQAVHLLINPALCLPQYLIYLINETSFGDLFLRSLQLPGSFPRIYVSQLLSATIYLPTIDRQIQIVDGFQSISRIRSEADELFQNLVDGSDDLDDITDRIHAVNQKDHFVDWIDTLPFPLSSILWRYYASQSSHMHSYEALFNFFEATAAFLATVHLSAFMRDPARWSQSAQGLSKKLADGHVSLERASFGTWRITTEYLSRLGFKELTQEASIGYNLARAHKLYATRNRRTLEMLMSKRLLHILQTANKLRNDWKGHAGAIGEDQAHFLHNQLRELVEQVRSEFGRKWTSYQLIRPGKMTYRDGVYTVECQLLMGTRNSPFEETIIEAEEVMDATHLYLYDRVERSGLKLAPLIDVLPSPEKETMACFIYNRLENESARWVSYHFDKTSEIHHSPSGLQRTISEIKQS